MQDEKNIENNDETNELDKDFDAESSDTDSVNLEELLKQKDLQIKELEEKYIRTHADFENTKKREFKKLIELICFFAFVNSISAEGKG